MGKHYIGADEIILYRKVIGYNNYSISNSVNVRNDKTANVFKQSLDNLTGYKYVKLRNERKCKNNRVYSLVASAFI